MKKIFVLLSGLVLGLSSAHAIVRDTVTTVTPNYYNNYYNHPAYRYKNSNNVYRNPYRYQQNYYQGSGHYDRYGNYYQPQKLIQRFFKSKKNTNEVNAAFKDTGKITQAEESILGRTFEYQDTDIRLNRLERSVFSRTYPEMSDDKRIDNIIANSSKDIPANKLSMLEHKVFNRNFSMDTAQNRIERLEEKMFGAKQSGELTPRYETLSRAAKQYGALPVVNSNGGWRNALGSFLMGGTPTGTTPSLGWGMDPAAMGFLDDRGAGGDASYYTGNRGWGYDNRSTGSRSGVTILD
ncbi:MAG: hypothetical protein LBK53_09835 [Heliobacteriaceae bacterium]|nr:hypothetical protein [Heliobacteriaceae bacterium]